MISALVGCSVCYCEADSADYLILIHISLAPQQLDTTTEGQFSLQPSQPLLQTQNVILTNQGICWK
jgi:hypothetical protein